MGGKSRTPEQIIAGIATRAHGIVTRAELLDAELTARQIDRRIASGALIPEYAGVYRVGHRAPSVEARYMAAVKACGSDAAQCGRAAGYLLRILKGPNQPPPEVLTTTERKPKGLKTRQTRRLDPRDV